MKASKFVSTSEGWAEFVTLVLAMTTMTCFSAMEKAKLVLIHARMTNDSALSLVDRNRLDYDIDRMLNLGIRRTP